MMSSTYHLITLFSAVLDSEILEISSIKYPIPVYSMHCIIKFGVK